MENSMTVRLVAAHAVDFVSKDTGECIKGTKLFFTRPCFDTEIGKGWGKEVKLDTVFIRPDQHINLPAFPAFPCDVDLVYTPAGKYNRLSAVRLSKQNL